MTPRALLAGLLGVAAAVLVACSGSSGKLIPVADSGPLQSDFEAVEQAAEAGNGSCSATEAAILKTEQDFAALPSSVDAGLRTTVHQGIANLRSRALALCIQPLVQATATSPKTTPAPTTSTPTTTTPTTPTTTTSTTPTTPATPTPTTPGSGGGTPAPGAGETPSGGGGQGGGTGAGEGNGQGGGAGGASGAGAGAGAGVGQEGAK